MINTITKDSKYIFKSIQKDYVSYGQYFYTEDGYKSTVVIFEEDYGLKGHVTVYDFAHDDSGHNIVRYCRKMSYNECLAWVKYLSKITG